MIISEKELVTRCSYGLVTICPTCYDVKKVINMILYEQKGKTGVIRNFCSNCAEAMKIECATCPKKPKVW